MRTQQARQRAEDEGRLRAKHAYRDGIKSQIVERKEKYGVAMEADKLERNRKIADDLYRKQVVEEYRKQLLAQHAQQLNGFLPKGVLKNQSDLEMMSLFDADGDGQLSSQEVANAQKMMMQYGDADGDGKLTDAERQRGFDQFKQRATQFDQDGDGQYSKEEAKAFWG